MAMPEHLRALIVIIGLSVPLLWFAPNPVCQTAITQADFKLRSNLWLFITVIAFIAHSFWAYVFISAMVLAIFGARDSNRLALFLFLLFVVPPFSAQLPGFSGINYLIDVNHPRILSLTILLPAYLSMIRDAKILPFGRTLADKSLLGYLVLQLVLQGLLDTTTNTMRSAIYAFIDVFLPYYVASRILRDIQACRDVLMSFVIAALVMTPMAAFEYAKGWLLYSSLPGVLGIRWGFGGYLMRADSLRAVVSTGHALVLGYVMMVALALFGGIRHCVNNATVRRLALLALLIGLLAPVSRGPWVGALTVLAVFLLTAPEKMSTTLKVFVVVLPIIMGVLMSPFAGKIVGLLPFIGTVDEFNVTYRQRLFEVSIGVILMNPFFGSFDAYAAPSMQELIQGEGIIDMVNSYLGIALAYGLVGLALFCAIFASAAWKVWRSLRVLKPGEELHTIGRALLAALAGIVITISTVSGISVIPTIYWVVAGLCISYAQLVEVPRDALAPSRATKQWFRQSQGSHR